jgi:hypothetical protein
MAPVIEGTQGTDLRSAFSERLERLLAGMPKPEDDLIESEAIESLTRASLEADSLHRFVMDLQEIDFNRRLCRIAGTTIPEGDFVSLDGHTGGVYAGKLEVVTDVLIANQPGLQNGAA